MRAQTLHPWHFAHLPLNDITHDPSLTLLFLHTVDILEDLIHIFERFPRCLRDAEEREDESKETEDSEEGVGAVSCILDEWWGDETLRCVSPLRFRQTV